MRDQSFASLPRSTTSFDRDTRNEVMQGTRAPNMS